MRPLSRATVVAYDRRLEQVGIPLGERPAMMKWVRFYLDHCAKYNHPPREATSLPPSLAKLAEKKQPERARAQAAPAVELLLGKVKKARPIAEGGEETPDTVELKRESVGQRPLGATAVEHRENQGRSSKATVVAASPMPAIDDGVRTGASWAPEYAELESSIRMRGYSPRTFEAYGTWIRKFQVFVRSKAPSALTGEDVKGFLSELAVRHRVAPSTQNQAFNALLYFFRHVLRRDLGHLAGVTRAKRLPYIPVVLSRAEVQRLLSELEAPYRLVASLLYGCGLRLTECIELRMHCLDLDALHGDGA